ncbi:DUF1367 family protein [Devosia sp.]|uniref:DUF1367 family protein n=1 Tax=Devosia sp. TaxID=1871048 RepID=UPI002FCBE54C
MAAEILMRREGSHLVPADQLAEEDVRELSAGAEFIVEVRKPRSLQHHRLLFALLRKVARSTETPLNENALRSWVLVRTGNVDVLPLGFGKTYEAPKSMSFANMDQGDFRKLFDAAVHLILTEVAPGLPDNFADEFIAMLDSKTLVARDGEVLKKASPKAA